MTPVRINPPLPTRTRKTTKKLRVSMTDAERALWFRLRGGRFDGMKFRRQHPVHPYVVDFYCHERALVVELDGSQHSSAADAARTSMLVRQGLKVLRFWDNQVFEDLDGVLRVILDTSRARTLTRRCAPPSPEGRGEQRKETME